MATAADMASNPSTAAGAAIGAGLGATGLLIAIGGAIVTGAAVTVIIFAGMRYLIIGDGSAPEERKRAPNIDIVSTRDDSQVITRSDRPDEPDEVKAPPPPPRIEAAKSEQPDEGLASILGSLPDINPDDVGGGDISFQVSDRDVQPLVRIPPQYPVRAAERGVEGSCDMTFNVAPDGTVISDSIQARCTSSLFARDATRAVARWKYQPKIQNGEAVPRYGVQTVLDFNLEE